MSILNCNLLFDLMGVQSNLSCSQSQRDHFECWGWRRSPVVCLLSCYCFRVGSCFMVLYQALFCWSSYKNPWLCGCAGNELTIGFLSWRHTFLSFLQNTNRPTSCSPGLHEGGSIKPPIPVCLSLWWADAWKGSFILLAHYIVILESWWLKHFLLCTRMRMKARWKSTIMSTIFSLYSLSQPHLVFMMTISCEHLVFIFFCSILLYSPVQVVDPYYSVCLWHDVFRAV